MLGLERYDLVLQAVEPWAEPHTVEDVLMERFALGRHDVRALLQSLPATLARDLDAAGAETALHGLRDFGLRVRLVPQVPQRPTRARTSSSPQQRRPSAPPPADDTDAPQAQSVVVIDEDEPPPSFFASFFSAFRVPFGRSFFRWFVRFVLAQIVIIAALFPLVLVGAHRGMFSAICALATFLAMLFTAGSFYAGTGLAWLQANMHAAASSTKAGLPDEADSISSVMSAGRAVVLSLAAQSIAIGVLYVYAVRAALERAPLLALPLTVVVGVALAFHNFVVIHQVAAGTSALRLLDIGASWRAVVAAPGELLTTLTVALGLSVALALIQQLAVVAIFAAVLGGATAADIVPGLVSEGPTVVTLAMLGGGLFLLILVATALNMVCSGIVAGLMGLAFRAKPAAAG